MIRVLSFVLVFGFGVGAYANDQIVGMAATVGTGAAISAGLNYGFGEKNKSICSSVPGGQWACPIAAMSFAQVIVDGVLGDNANKTKSQARASSGDFSTASSNAFNDSTPTNPDIAKFVDGAKKGLQDLEKEGFKLNNDGSITGPNGKTASAASLSSGQSAADAGFIDSEDIQKYDEVLANHKKKKDKIIVKSLGGAKGGYKARRSRRSSASVDSYGSYGSGLGSSKIKAAQTSGLTKDFGGTPIGVASDDLFNMIAERYSVMREDSKFIDNAAGTYTGQR